MMELDEAIDICRRDVYETKILINRAEESGRTYIDLDYYKKIADALETVLKEVEKNGTF